MKWLKLKFKLKWRKCPPTCQWDIKNTKTVVCVAHVVFFFVFFCVRPQSGSAGEKPGHFRKATELLLVRWVTDVQKVAVVQIVKTLPDTLLPFLPSKRHSWSLLFYVGVVCSAVWFYLVLSIT